MKMKKIAKSVLSIFVVSMLLSVSVFASFAKENTPVVTYDGAKEEFVYENVMLADNKNPDLFTELKGVMPGDSFEQDITVAVANIGKDEVKLSLKAENENDAFQALMESVTYTVVGAGEDITGKLADTISLGSYDADSLACDIVVKLDIPVTAGNEIKDLYATVDWVFTAEVIPYVEPVEPDTSKPVEPDTTAPDTGDSSNTFAVGAMLIMSVTALMAVVLKRKSKI